MARKTHSLGGPIQSLESREVMNFSALSAGGYAYITGTDRAETIRVADTGTTIQVSISGIGSKAYSKSAVRCVVIDARGGNDTVSNGTAISSIIKGGEGSDRIYGGANRDTIYGGNGTFVGDVNGHDVIYGGGENDLIYGEAGNDAVFGDAGNDYLYGGTGNDALTGGKDDDALFGEAGNDILRGEAGTDYLSGGDNDDVLLGGVGVDRMFGGGGTDKFYLTYNGLGAARKTIDVLGDRQAYETLLDEATATH